MPANADFAEQLRRARKRYEERQADITMAEIGERVARLLGEPEPVSVQLVSRWFQGWEPRFSVGCALARVLGADPLELAPLKSDAPLADHVAPLLPRGARLDAFVDEEQAQQRKRAEERKLPGASKRRAR